MNKQVMIAIVSAILFVALVAGTANAQSKEKFTIEIPFAFVINGERLQPGKYTIEHLNPSRPEMLVIKSVDRQMAKSFMTQRVGGRSPEGHAKLLFNQYGDEYYLAEVWAGGGALNGRQVPRSEAEGE